MPTVKNDQLANDFVEPLLSDFTANYLNHKEKIEALPEQDKVSLAIQLLSNNTTRITPSMIDSIHDYKKDEKATDFYTVLERGYTLKNLLENVINPENTHAAEHFSEIDQDIYYQYRELAEPFLKENLDAAVNQCVLTAESYKILNTLAQKMSRMMPGVDNKMSCKLQQAAGAKFFLELLTGDNPLKVFLSPDFNVDYFTAFPQLFVKNLPENILNEIACKLAKELLNHPKQNIVHERLKILSESYTPFFILKSAVDRLLDPEIAAETFCSLEKPKSVENLYGFFTEYVDTSEVNNPEKSFSLRESM